MPCPTLCARQRASNYELFFEQTLEAELKAGKKASAVLIDETGPDYPKVLSQLDDAPPFLWALGKRELLTAPMIAMVGARNASSLGTRMARRLSPKIN